MKKSDFKYDAYIDTRNNVDTPVNVGSKDRYFTVDSGASVNLISRLDLAPGEYALKRKFKFFPICEHGRTSRRAYLNDPTMPFVVSQRLVKREAQFFQSLNAARV